MKAWWQHYRENLTPDICEAIIARALTLPEKPAAVGHGSETRMSEHRRGTVRWIDRHDHAMHLVFSHIVLNALEVNRNAFGLELSNEPRLRFNHGQFTTYQAETNDKFEWHEDNCWTPERPMAYDRKLSCVVQLSDPATYEGGRLELDPPDKGHALPADRFTQQGDMIFFPSHLRHRVTPVTAGTRHSLVVWFEGPPLR